MTSLTRPPVYTSIDARLSKDGTHVLCGKADCGYRFAPVHVAFRGQSTEEPCFLLESVWRRHSDECWRLPRNVKNRLAEDHGIAVDHVRWNEELATPELMLADEGARRRLASGRAVRGRRLPDRPVPTRDEPLTATLVMQHAVTRSRLARDVQYIQCPKCGVPNRLRADMFDVAL